METRRPVGIVSRPAFVVWWICYRSELHGTRLTGPGMMNPFGYTSGLPRWRINAWLQCGHWKVFLGSSPLIGLDVQASRSAVFPQAPQVMFIQGITQSPL